jgi:ribosomal-protein-alanine N-acetyltransferase
MEFQLALARLRPWAPGDEDGLVRHANNRKIWRNVLDVFPHPYTHADAVEYIHQLVPASDGLILAIEVEGEAAGSIGLHFQPGVWKHSAEIGYWLAESHWRKGITTEAVLALTRYGLEELSLQRIFARVFEWNAGSMRVLGKAGYTLEGRHRKAVIKDGQIIDDLTYAVVRETRAIPP